MSNLISNQHPQDAKLQMANINVSLLAADEMQGPYEGLLSMIEAAEISKKKQRLKDLDLFVLDNSLRESTVGQLKGHTVQDKFNILEEVKKCGFNHIVVSAFSHRPRVDDAFVEAMIEKEPDLSKFYAFSEIVEEDSKSTLPYGLEKMIKYKLKNPIFEIDLAKSDSENFIDEICDLLEKRIKLTYKALSSESKIFVNLRDMPFAMEKCPTHVFRVVETLGKMPLDIRPCGIMYEEPSGKFLPETLGVWTKALRKLMDSCNWDDGHLLFHVHKKWGFAEAVQLECLANGANGIWASVCEEGAAIGHASSILTIMNLIRLGNKKVLERYNCEHLREAAINITKFTTGMLPHPRQAVYGGRALDLVFECSGLAGGPIRKGEFDIAKFFKMEHPIRINHLASEDMIQQKLVNQFGKNPQFTLEMAARMKEQIVEDLKKPEDQCKEEYTSKVGLTMLFVRAGGHPIAEMADAIEDENVKAYQKRLILKVKEEWDKCGPDKESDSLDYQAFYHGFMAPFFGHYECETTKQALYDLDMHEDHKIQFREFCVYLKWALREYPEKATTPESLVNIAFQKGLLSAMHHTSMKKDEDLQICHLYS